MNESGALLVMAVLPGSGGLQRGCRMLHAGNLVAAGHAALVVVPCVQDIRTRSTTGAPLLTRRGAHDASNDLVQCMAREEESRAAGSEAGSRTHDTDRELLGFVDEKLAQKQPRRDRSRII